MVFSFKYFNVVALAALTAKLTLIDSSLMQNALTFYSDVDPTPIPISNLKGFASTEWPNTGTVDNGAGEAQFMQEWPLGVFTLWRDSAGDYPTESWGGCHVSLTLRIQAQIIFSHFAYIFLKNAFCFTNVPAFGFKFDCSPKTSEHLNIMQSLEDRSSNGSGETVFDISFDTVYRDETPSYEGAPHDTAYIFMNVTWTHSWIWFEGGGGCAPIKENIACNLFPHVVEYPAVIDHISNVRTISVGARKLNKWSEAGAKSTVGFNPDGHGMNFKTGQQNK